jgi:hypothetical protein
VGETTTTSAWDDAQGEVTREKGMPVLWDEEKDEPAEHEYTNYWEEEMENEYHASNEEIPIGHKEGYGADEGYAADTGVREVDGDSALGNRGIGIAEETVNPGKEKESADGDPHDEREGAMEEDETPGQGQKGDKGTDRNQEDGGDSSDPDSSDSEATEKDLPLIVDIEVKNEMVGRILGKEGDRKEHIKRLTGCYRMEFLGEKTDPVRILRAWVPNIEVAHEVNRLVRKLIKACLSGKEGALRKVIRNYCPKTHAGQRKHPSSLIEEIGSDARVRDSADGPQLMAPSQLMEGEQDKRNARTADTDTMARAKTDEGEAKPAETGVMATSKKSWAASKAQRDTIQEGDDGRSATSTPPRSGGKGNVENPYSHPRKVKRDDTPLTNAIHTRSHAIPGEHGTPLDPAKVRERERREGRGFKAELSP